MNQSSPQKLLLAGVFLCVTYLKLRTDFELISWIALGIGTVLFIYGTILLLKRK